MEIKNKAAIAIGMAWICFLLLTSFQTIRESSISYFTLVTVFSLILLVLALRRRKINELPKEKPSELKLDTTNGSNYPWLAHYDNLTSLPNRVFFNETLNKAINHAKRHHKILAILLININDFKQLNEKLGSDIGDSILIELGNRFKKCLRSDDILARQDGDEFIVLLNDIGKPKFASTVAEKILQSCSQPIKTNSHETSITASIGICIHPNDGNSLEELLSNVDSALFKAKKSKQNVYQFYTQEMDIEGHEYIQLEAALRKAIENNELTLYYQPKLHIKRGHINGVEALIRWIHPDLGILNPSLFLSVAEEAGFMMEIGEWILREACKTNKYWQDEGYEHLSVSVNLSPKQFHHPDIANIINNVLTETGLNPKYLELEITETAVMSNAEMAVTILEKIKGTGVQISIDHFGTGYTSISHLKQFPISTIKIDQSFIKGIPNKPDDSAITCAVIALAHTLGFEVIAEGVETAEQVQFLSLQNCDTVQGYFLSHPLPADKIILQFKKLTDEVLF